MKDILGVHFETVKIDILDYLSTSSSHFIDKRVLKTIKIFIINDSDEQTRYRQKKALKQQILESEERYDLKWMSVLLLDLINEDFQEVAYTLKKIQYDKLHKEILDRLDLLRRVARLVYLYHDDKILEALEYLLEYPTPNSISTNSILWEFYHMDSEDTDYDTLIEMATKIYSYRPTEYTTQFFLGYIYVEQELFHQALNSYSKALELCQANSNLYEQQSWLCMRVADCQYNMKQHKEVIESTDQALQLYTKYNTGKENEMDFFHFIFRLRCKSFYIMKDYKNALNDANSALEFCHPENRDAMLELIETIKKHC